MYVPDWTKTETGQSLDDAELHLVGFEKMASALKIALHGDLSQPFRRS
jgi:hypothetical protein